MTDRTLLKTLIQTHSPKDQESEFKELFDKDLKFGSIFDITRLTEAEFAARVRAGVEARQSLSQLSSSIDTKTLFDNVRCLAAQLTHLYREQRTSDGKAQHHWHPSSIRKAEEQAPTYTHLFMENWDDACKVDSIAAIDSQVAYLRALYLFALQLESSPSVNSEEKNDRILLAARRPDLSLLSISHQSTFTAQPMLRIVNETLDNNIRAGLLSAPDKAQSTYKLLAQRQFPFVLPYEFFHHQCLLGLNEKNTALGELNYRISQHLPLSQHESHLYGSAPQSSPRVAQALMSGLGPKRQALLTDWPDARTLSSVASDSFTAEQQSQYWKPVYGPATTDDLSHISTFLERTGLNADQLEALLAQGRYALHNSPQNRLGASSFGAGTARYVNGATSARYPAMTIDRNAKPARITHATAQRLERLHRMIRLQRWLEMPFADLDVLICSAMGSPRAPEPSLQIDRYVIRALGVYRYFQRNYSLKAEEFAALLHLVSTSATSDEPALFDRIFNQARLFDEPLLLDGRAFSSNPTDPLSHSVLQHLSASLGIPLSENALLNIVKNTEKQLGSLKCDAHTLSSIYRQARIAQLFGFTVSESATLANLLGGERIAAYLVSGQTKEHEIKVDCSDLEGLKINLSIGAPLSADMKHWHLLPGSSIEIGTAFFSDSIDNVITVRYPRNLSGELPELYFKMPHEVAANTVTPLAGTVSTYGGTLDELLQLQSPFVTLTRQGANRALFETYVKVTLTSAESAPRDLDMLDVLMQMDWISRWIKQSVFDIPGLQQLLEPASSSEQMLGKLLQHFTSLQAATRKAVVTTPELAALSLPDSANLRAELAIDLLDEKGLVKNFAPLATDDASEKMDAALEKLPALLIHVDDDAQSQRLKKNARQKLKDLLLPAHDRQQHLIETFLQETCWLPMTCAKGVVTWAKSSIHRILLAALSSERLNALASTLEPVLRHARAAVQLQMSNRALQVFQNHPDWLQRSNSALALTLETLYLLDRLVHCMTTHQHDEESLLNYLELANEPGSSADASNLHLARLLNWTPAQVSLLTARLPRSRASTMEDIDWLVRCHDTCAKTGLGAAALLDATRLQNDSPEEHWKSVGEAVMASGN